MAHTYMEKLSKDPELLKLFHNPSIIVTTRESAFSRIENLILLAQHHSGLECRLYPLINRIMTELCGIAYCDSDGSIMVEAHNQAVFDGGILKDSLRRSIRVPDITACIFPELDPAIWIEAKSLPLIAGNDWRTSEHAKHHAAELFQGTVVQAREQARYAFKHFSRTRYAVIIEVGLFWSLLMFHKDREERAQEIEVTAQITTPQKYTRKRIRTTTQRKDYKDRRQTKQEEETTFFSADCLPDLIYFNELLVPEKPATRLNPHFLHAMHNAFKERGFQIQPSWFSVPKNYDPRSAEQLEAGLQCIRNAYEKEVVEHSISRQLAREIEKEEEPEDSDDSDYTESSQLPDLSERRQSERQRRRGDTRG